MPTIVAPDQLIHAVVQGKSIAHLTPEQAYAIHILGMPAGAITNPLPKHLVVLLANIDRMARKGFKQACSNPEGLIEAAYDERHPYYLRRPVQAELARGMRECFPELRPTGVDSNGQCVYRASDVATALDTSEVELKALGERHGMQNATADSDVTPIH
ncbi:hypothetical protein R3F64_15715 [Halomonas sp. 5021]|jgi:hypothetical protein|uniref:hypothetical protein n=1 Tax=Halomonas sp. 5021 TaxID=3082156 RepID=UPI002FC78CC2